MNSVRGKSTLAGNTPRFSCGKRETNGPSRFKLNRGCRQGAGTRKRFCVSSFSPAASGTAYTELKTVRSRSRLWRTSNKYAAHMANPRNIHRLATAIRMHAVATKSTSANHREHGKRFSIVSMKTLAPYITHPRLFGANPISRAAAGIVMSPILEMKINWFSTNPADPRPEAHPVSDRRRTSASRYIVA